MNISRKWYRILTLGCAVNPRNVVTLVLSSVVVYSVMLFVMWIIVASILAEATGKSPTLFLWTYSLGEIWISIKAVLYYIGLGIGVIAGIIVATLVWHESSEYCNNLLARVIPSIKLNITDKK